MDQPYDALSAAHASALAHPARHRILGALGAEGATVSQLAVRLATNKGNVAHHLKVLVTAGLVRPGRTRTVRGGTEQYFVRVAEQIRFAAGDQGAATKAMLAAIADEVPRDDDHLLHHRTVRLTARQARALGEHLDRIVTELEPASDRDRAYGVLVGLWQTDRPSTQPARSP